MCTPCPAPNTTFGFNHSLSSGISTLHIWILMFAHSSCKITQVWSDWMDCWWIELAIDSPLNGVRVLTEPYSNTFRFLVLNHSSVLLRVLVLLEGETPSSSLVSSLLQPGIGFFPSPSRIALHMTPSCHSWTLTSSPVPADIKHIYNQTLIYTFWVAWSSEVVFGNVLLQTLRNRCIYTEIIWLMANRWTLI